MVVLVGWKDWEDWGLVDWIWFGDEWVGRLDVVVVVAALSWELWNDGCM